MLADSLGVMLEGIETTIWVAEAESTVQDTPPIVTVGLVSKLVPVICKDPPATTDVESRAVIFGVKESE